MIEFRAIRCLQLGEFAFLWFFWSGPFKAVRFKWRLRWANREELAEAMEGRYKNRCLRCRRSLDVEPRRRGVWIIDCCEKQDLCLDCWAESSKDERWSYYTSSKWPEYFTGDHIKRAHDLIRKQIFRGLVYAEGWSEQDGEIHVVQLMDRGRGVPTA